MAMVMRRKAFALALTLGAMVLVASPAAASEIYIFHFTGADLLNNAFVDGADGSTAADNDLYAGARLLHQGASPTHADVGSTFQQSQHDNFINRWNQYTADGYVLDEFHLWGFGDGRTSPWGEAYKPFEWVSLTGPDGWQTNLETWAPTWGDAPEGSYTDKYPRWIGGPDHGLQLGATIEELQALEFTATIAFDPEDAWWDVDTQGAGSVDAPNSLTDGELTMWFSSYITQYDQAGNFADYHVYEGNLTALAPSPAAAGAGLVGMMTMMVVRRRRMPREREI